MDYLTVDILISLLTIIIMFGIGLSINLKEIKMVFASPKPLLAALVSQMVILPLFAFGLCLCVAMPSEFKLGLIVLASSPGGTTSALITYLLRGNVALSLTLTILNTLLTLFTIPIIVLFGLKTFNGIGINIIIPIWEIILQIILFVIIPTVVGMITRFCKKEIATKLENVLKIIMFILLIFVFIIKFTAGTENGGVVFNSGEVICLLPVTLLFNVGCLVFAYYFIGSFDLDIKNKIAAFVESSVHNVPLALLITGSIIKNQEMSKPILIYSTFSFWTPIVFGILLKKISNYNR